MDPFWTLRALRVVLEEMITSRANRLEEEILLNRFKHIADRLEKYCHEQGSSTNETVAFTAAQALSPRCKTKIVQPK
jgi:hypothetical protein